MAAGTTPKHFALAVRRYQSWVDKGKSEGVVAAREALAHLGTLFALGARATEHGRAASKRNEARCAVSDEEWNRVFKSLGRLPVNYYSEVFNPLPVPAGQEPVTGDVADDLADIYRDVVVGLRLYELGDLRGAQWQWVFFFVHHWGEHAASAMRALHYYVADADPALDSYGA